MQLIVEERENSEKQIALRYSDTFRINFDGGFNNDIVKIKIGKKKFVSSVLNTHELLGFAGRLNIPKVKVKHRIKIFFNNIYIGELGLKKEYSEAHINYFEGVFRWTYINYHFGYL